MVLSFLFTSIINYDNWFTPNCVRTTLWQWSKLKILLDLSHLTCKLFELGRLYIGEWNPIKLVNYQTVLTHANEHFDDQSLSLLNVFWWSYSEISVTLTLGIMDLTRRGDSSKLPIPWALSFISRPSATSPVMSENSALGRWEAHHLSFWIQGPSYRKKGHFVIFGNYYTLGTER